MIQKWIKDELNKVLPELEWTMDFKTGQDHTGVVYYDSPGRPSKDDFMILSPSYEVEIVSSDLEQVETIAWKVYEAMNKRRTEHAVISPGIEFDIIFIQAIPPLPVGMDGKKMTYMINLEGTIRKTSKTLI